MNDPTQVYNPRTRQWERPGEPDPEGSAPSDPIMPFGKHAGLRLSEIDGGYLSWLVREGVCDDPELHEAVRRELRSR